MAETYKPMGGQKPAATTNTVLYTCPAATTAVVGWLQALSTNGQDDSIRVYVLPNGQSVGDQYAIYKDTVVDAFDPLMINAPIVLAAGDEIIVFSTNGTSAFNGSVVEIT